MTGSDKHAAAMGGAEGRGDIVMPDKRVRGTGEQQKGEETGGGS